MSNKSPASIAGITMPDQRLRTDGILSQVELEWCQANDVPLGYDCVQNGWVPLQVQNNLPDGGSSRNERDSFLRLIVTNCAALRALIVEKKSEHAQKTERTDRDISALIEAEITEICHRTFNDNGDIDQNNELHLALWAEANLHLPGARGAITPSRVFGYQSWHERDAQRYYEIFANEKVWLHLPEQRPTEFTAEIARHMIEAANIGSHHHTCAVVLDRQIIGQIRLLFDETSNGLRGAEVAYLLGEQWWGRGLMPEILSDFTQRSFKEHRLQYIYAWIEKGHTASIRCCERAGYVRDCFSEEAVLADQSNRSGFVRYIKFVRGQQK